MTELFDPTRYRYVFKIESHYGPDLSDYWEGQMAIFATREGLDRWLVEHNFVSTGYGYKLQTVNQEDTITTVYASILIIPYVEG